MKTKKISQRNMSAKKIFRIFFVVTVLSLNVGCDQISKNIVRQKIDYKEQISLVNNHFTLTKIENTGAFLSLGQFLPQSIKLLLLIILPVIILSLIFFYVLKKQKLSNITIIGLCFIAGGGFGNIYDRIIYGSVTDFMHIDFAIFQTGIFNMADVSIMVGLFLIILELYIKRPKLDLEIVDNITND